MVAGGKLAHGPDHFEDRRHDRTIGHVDDCRGDADACAQQHPKQRGQEIGFGENRRTVGPQIVLLPRNHAPHTRAHGVLRSREDIEQPVGARSGFIG